MHTVVFVVDAVPSHVYASMGLARRLERRGYSCEYWGSPLIERLVTEQGFGFRHLDGIWSRYQAEIRLPTDLTGLRLLAHPRVLWTTLQARRDVARRLPAALDRFELSLDARLRAGTPAFAVFDPFLLGYLPYFRQRGITGIVLSSKPLPVRDPLVPPYSSPVVPADGLGRRVAIRAAWLRLGAIDAGGRLLRLATRLLGAYTHDDLVREAAGRNGFPLRAERVRRWVTPDLHFASVPEWALWDPEADLPRRRLLPANVCYVGSCVDFERAEPSVPARRNAKARYLIYAAVGTVRFRWRDNLTFLARVMEAFGNDPRVQLVISTGDERATAALGQPPANVELFDFLPQLKMLRIADLVITHAGAGTYREAIACEVPMLAYPRNHDQIGNAARVVFHGLGLRGSREDDSAAAIRAKAFRILEDPACARNVRQLRHAAAAGRERLLDQALFRIGAAAMVPGIASRAAAV
jgi:zeaxanthin glucosyltransferase